MAEALEEPPGPGAAWPAHQEARPRHPSAKLFEEASLKPTGILLSHTYLLEPHIPLRKL